MAINESWILIHGDHRDKFPDLFLKFYGYWPTGRIFPAKSREEANSFVGYEDRDQDGSMEVVQKPVFLLGSWTVIDDPELILMDEIEGLLSVSDTLSTTVLAIQSLERSVKYGFRHVQTGKVRSLISWSGEISVNEGSPIPEEGTRNQDRFDEQDVIGLLSKFQVDFEQANQVTEFQVYELEESEEGELNPRANAKPIEDQGFGSSAQNKLSEKDFKSPEVKTPWWKFW